MFWRILKKDLKRKRTMNAILLMFVIMCSMFAAASVNNIAAVTGGIEHFFNASDVPDVTVGMEEDSDEDKNVEKIAGVREVKTEHPIYIYSSRYFRHKGKKLNNFINPAVLIADDEMAIKYFDADNNVIKSVEKGSFYCTKTFIQDLDVSEGDEFEINVDGFSYKLTYKGLFKGALIDTSSAALPYLILNGEDFDNIEAGYDNPVTRYKTMYIKTDNVKAITDYAEATEGLFAATRDSNKGIYIFDMMVAYVMMAISIIIMLAAFVVLRFTIGFTIQEEYREIGVMKALGISNTSIRSLYIVKYLAIAVVGAVVGFFCSLPLSSIMLKTVSENMVLGSENGAVLSIISSVCIIAIIMLFCYICTRKVKKLSPIDAVRSGQTGERFRKRSLLRLGRSKLPSTGFLALNDVLSAPKQFLIITVVFTLCILMMTVMATSATTLKSEKLLRFFNAPESDITILDTEFISELMTKPHGYEDTLDKSEKLLDDLGIDGTYSTSFGTQSMCTHGDKTSSKIFFIAVRGTTDYMVECDEGSAPRKSDEIAMTGYAMESLDAKIGDRITATIADKDYEFIITGKCSSFFGGGYAAIVHEDFEVGDAAANAFTGVQIRLDGDPGKAEIDRAIEKIREELDSDKVYTTEDTVKTMTQVSDSLNAIKKLTMILTVILTGLIVILMERSFISKEKSETALMKAVGIPSRSIILQHVLRFVIVSLIACVIASAVVLPASSALLSWVSSMIGDISGIDVDYSPAEVFALCPAILLAVTAIGSFITALSTKKITASDTASIE
ncbi:MAG: ABC transporter permease [Ruminococcus sp.]|nr:ABC transporter permease [Ruminococcus sp.]